MPHKKFLVKINATIKLLIKPLLGMHRHWVRRLRHGHTRQLHLQLTNMQFTRCMLEITIPITLT